ncbi:hypothetical protein Mgra_00009746 [Meloidogyne graminicola]|uniref:Uncharacterized protein n=1 Tax=Meloidogyne graminicola TaxID=189291 RepID=A0A8S9ZBI9_9BILA|nr:hypothetical protein Mgra_00009746 [Meloidogyne graminicola]
MIFIFIFINCLYAGRKSKNPQRAPRNDFFDNDRIKEIEERGQKDELSSTTNEIDQTDQVQNKLHVNLKNTRRRGRPKSKFVRLNDVSYGIEATPWKN